MNSQIEEQAELRKQVQVIHGRLHGRIRTHEQVAKHSLWTREELDQVISEDYMLFEVEIVELIAKQKEDWEKETEIRVRRGIEYMYKDSELDGETLARAIIKDNHAHLVKLAHLSSKEQGGSDE